MPLVSIVPTTERVEEELAGRMEAVRRRIKDMVCYVSGFPRTDVIVNLLRCPFKDADLDSAELVLYVDTCPHEVLEGRADELCEEVARVLVELGFTAGRGAEVWPRFLPGPWCLVKGREIVDKVSHPRDKS